MHRGGALGIFSVIVKTLWGTKMGWSPQSWSNHHVHLEIIIDRIHPLLPLGGEGPDLQL